MWSAHVARHLNELPLNMLRVRANKLTTLLLLWGFRCFKDLILQCKCGVRIGSVRLLFIRAGWGEAGLNTARLYPSLLLLQHSFGSDSGHTSTNTDQTQTNKQTNRYSSDKWACGQKVSKQTNKKTKTNKQREQLIYHWHTRGSLIVWW